MEIEYTFLDGEEDEEEYEECSTCGYKPCACDDLYEDYQEKTMEMWGD